MQQYRPLRHTPCWKTKQYNFYPLGKEIYCNAKKYFTVLSSNMSQGSIRRNLLVGGSGEVAGTLPIAFLLFHQRYSNVWRLITSLLMEPKGNRLRFSFSLLRSREVRKLNSFVSIGPSIYSSFRPILSISSVAVQTRRKIMPWTSPSWIYKNVGTLGYFLQHFHVHLFRIPLPQLNVDFGLSK